MSDHERPLNARGRDAAPKIGAALQARGYAPELIWSSDSKRTRETAMLLIRAIAGAQEVNFSSGFYHASPDIALDIAARLGEPNVKRLMWLGHNPGWSGLFEYFTGQSDPFPTGACAVLKRKADGDWLSPKNWTLIDFIKPRDLS